jgi:predicted metal-dependent hydrolase
MDHAIPPAVPRYSARLLPARRFVPGETVRPEDSTSGRTALPPWQPEAWREIESWLWAIDLFNHGYWWECHEALEALWLSAGRATPPARFVQSLVHLSAACLNDRRGHRDASRRQAARAVRGLRAARSLGPRVMGVDPAALAESVVRAFSGDSSPASLRILLSETAS